MDEILKLLGVDALDEGQQTTIKEKLDDIIDVKSRERADDILKDEGTKLTEEYEGKFDDYKKEITSKFSSFVDSILDEELLIPEKVMEFARKGELYNELIEQFKIRLAVDEGVLDSEVKSLLKEAKDEISDLRENVNTITGDNLTLKLDAREMAASLYLRQKCDGLTEVNRTKVLNILEGITEKEEIDKKYNIVLENVLNEKNGDDDEDADKDEKLTYVCPECGEEVTKDAEGEYKCPKCETVMTVKKAVKEGTDIDGKGTLVVNEGAILDDTTDDPFSNNIKRWKEILSNNKI